MANRIPPSVVAHHEAGHAVASYFLALKIKRVTIIPSGDSRGLLEHWPMPRWFHPELAEYGDVRHRYLIERHVQVFLAGPEAEARLIGRHNWKHGASDLDSAVSMLSYISGSGEETSARLRLSRIQADQIVRKHWTLIQRLAAVLVERKTMTGPEVVNAINSVMREETGGVFGGVGF